MSCLEITTSTQDLRVSALRGRMICLPCLGRQASVLTATNFSRSQVVRRSRPLQSNRCLVSPPRHHVSSKSSPGQTPYNIAPFTTRLTKRVKQVSRVSPFLALLFSCYSCRPNYNLNIKCVVLTHLFCVIFRSCHCSVFEIADPTQEPSTSSHKIHTQSPHLLLK